MHAAVVKLNSLTDSVRPRAQDDYLSSSRGRRLSLTIVAGVKVGGVSHKLGGAGINSFVDRLNVVPDPLLADLAFRELQQLR